MTHTNNITGDTFFGWDGDVLVVNILGKPSAVKDAIGKPYGKQLKVSVTASPVNGCATDQMLRFLAPHFGVTVSDIELVFGRMSVHKQVRITSPTQLPAVFTPNCHGRPTTLNDEPVSNLPSPFPRGLRYAHIFSCRV